VDKELLTRHSEGLIGLSACLQGEVTRLLLQGRGEDARQAARWYQQNLPEFYLELQPHPMPEVEQANRELIKLSTEMGMPLVATNDVHYVRREDAYAHDLLMCIQTNTSIYDEKRIKMPGDYFYMRGPQDIAEAFADVPQAVENTGLIADSCNLELEFGQLHLPKVEIDGGVTADEHLSELCWKGFHRLFPEGSPEAENRLRYELDVIATTGFTSYFLVVWDIVTFARKRGILVGVRGSAAASLALYCLGITEIDPLGHRLVFERFLNLERREMPDIDVDFQDDRRDEVIAYVTERYGQDHVAQIITFGTLGAKAVVRDVGRALGLPYSQADRVARLIPGGPNVTLERAAEENPELRDIYRQDETVTRLVDSSRKLEGIARHASTHAAGVVISPEPLTNYVPLQRANRSEGVMTQFTMESIAQIGLLKMDLLGLGNLTVLDRIRPLVAQHRGIEIDLAHLPLDDAKTYELLSSGETNSVFQLEGGGMRRFIKELKPSSFKDIAALVALYRPGPMEHIPTFIRAKHGLEPVRYPDPTLQDILEETYGVIVYQDQVLLIVQALAGYTLGEADIFRKAMGKKIPEVMRKERQRFLRGAEKKGFSKGVASEVFQLIEPFAGYAFNKAHSVSYALIAYQTAYCKANYPMEYMTAVLNTTMDNQAKMAAAVVECQRLGIKVLPPDVSHSGPGFSIEEESIRFGLAAVKNVGVSAVEPVLEARAEGGDFTSIEDFCHRVDLRRVNKRALESLIKVGALDGLGHRLGLLHSLDRIMSLSQQRQHLQERGQTSMFDLWGQSVPVPMPSLEMDSVEVTPRERMSWEKELLGILLSSSDLGEMARETRHRGAALCGNIDEDLVGQRIVVAGMLSSVRAMTTRDRRSFVICGLEDISGNIEISVWSEVYGRTQELWEEGNLVVVSGRVKQRAGEIGISCERAEAYQPSAAPQAAAGVGIGQDTASPVQRMVVRLTATGEEDDDRALLQQVVAMLREFPGEVAVRLAIGNGEEESQLVDMPPELKVDESPLLHRRLASLVGEAGVQMEP
ncbi:MAG: DNA polymerase III subunit alpha, partial [Dehalococcoidia bacterium]|nr:DNA polymerase III subunit alpha [Dehalococcoidia bacterium]